MASVSVQGGPENIPCERGDTVREVMLAGKAELYYTMKGATTASGTASVPLAAGQSSICACACACVNVCAFVREFSVLVASHQHPRCVSNSQSSSFLTETQLVPHHITCYPAFVDTE